jgi:hypothetical protein
VGLWTTGVEIFRTFRETDYGLRVYIRAHVADYPKIARDVASQIVNHNVTYSGDIAEKLGKSHVLVFHILKHLQSRGLLKTSKQMNGFALSAWDCSPELSYLLQDNSSLV